MGIAKVLWAKSTTHGLNSSPEASKPAHRRRATKAPWPLPRSRTRPGAQHTPAAPEASTGSAGADRGVHARRCRADPARRAAAQTSTLCRRSRGRRHEPRPRPRRDRRGIPRCRTRSSGHRWRGTLRGSTLPHQHRASLAQRLGTHPSQYRIRTLRASPSATRSLPDPCRVSVRSGRARPRPHLAFVRRCLRHLPSPRTEAWTSTSGRSMPSSSPGPTSSPCAPTTTPWSMSWPTPSPSTV